MASPRPAVEDHRAPSSDGDLRDPITADPVVAGTRSADKQTERVFSTAILISAVRCTLTYVILPFVAPLIGFASGVGPGVGIVIGVVAIAANIVSIRRFHRADHKWKWPATVIQSGIMVLLAVLVADDLIDLFG